MFQTHCLAIFLMCIHIFSEYKNIALEMKTSLTVNGTPIVTLPCKDREPTFLSLTFSLSSLSFLFLSLWLLFIYLFLVVERRKMFYWLWNHLLFSERWLLSISLFLWWYLKISFQKFHCSQQSFYFSFSMWSLIDSFVHAKMHFLIPFTKLGT